MTFLRTYLRALDDYSILDKGWTVLAEPSDPARRREAKIAAFKAERELKSNIEPTIGSDDDERTRNLWLARLRLAALQARTALQISKQEIEMLAEAPPSPDPAEAAQKRDDEDTTWRLDSLDLNRLPRNGPLLDQTGKPLRPFTILPTRQDVKVFGPSHRLPTMSVDEFLEAESSRMITGGGQAGIDRDLEERDRKINRLEGDNLEAEDAQAEDRAEKQRWDAYLDEHRRGEGNRLGRG